MKSIPLFLIVFLLGAQPLLSHAQVYKWKDKDGSIRYTDTPPPSNIQQETIIKKKTETPIASPAPVATPSQVQNPAQVSNPNSSFKEIPSPEAEAAAAQMRQRKAEDEKRAKQEKEAEAKRKADNCKAARANYQAYNQGGRVYKMNEKGEREYMDNKELNAGKAQAQQEINMNCS